MGCGLAIGAAILLRPDGGLILIAIELYLALLWVRASGQRRSAREYARGHTVSSHLLRVGLIVALVSLAPLVPWAWRNVHTMHRFEALAPRYANEEDEFVPAGFNRWVKTWMADYASVEEIYWPVPGDTVDAAKLPARAFDSEAQRQQTDGLAGGLQPGAPRHSGTGCPFRGFGRASASGMRHCVTTCGFRLLRVADMWLRPRTETLPSDTRWWEFNDDPKWSALAVALGIIGLVYIGTAIGGLAVGALMKHRTIAFLGLLLTFVMLRSVFLGTLENPEPRYTLECYPVVIILAAVFAARSS